MRDQRWAIVGGGIIGAALAHRVLQARPDAAVSLLEKEADLGLHQTGHNSGVVHAGLYYQPGSLKARLCRRGVDLLRDFCAEHAITYTECGKVVVALDEAEEARLNDIVSRARANGVPGIRVVSRGELAELEPHVNGRSALHSPSTAIVDFTHVTRRLAAAAADNGAMISTSCEVVELRESGREVIVGWRTSDGGIASGAFDLVVLCAGLQSDRMAILAGDGADPRIVPFRGEYYLLHPQRRDLVGGLVYPVPDPRYPFLGVHVTPRVDGEVMIGPNAVLAMAREGYRWSDVSLRDVAGTIAAPGFRRFARRHWRTGIREVVGSLSKSAFVEAARRYVPELTAADVVRGPSGVRAQALDFDGALVDDFRISRRGRVMALRNAPSPAATSSMAIAEHIVDLVLAR